MYKSNVTGIPAIFKGTLIQDTDSLQFKFFCPRTLSFDKKIGPQQTKILQFAVRVEDTTFRRILSTQGNHQRYTEYAEEMVILILSMQRNGKWWQI